MTRMLQTTRRLIAVAALTAALGACGGDDSAMEGDPSDDTTATTASTSEDTAGSATTAPGGGAAETDAVDIKGFKFVPAEAKVAVGDKVTWTNSDSAVHTVVADDKSFESDDLAQGDAFSFTFTKAGTFPYKCGIHNSMKGTVVVA